MSCPFLPVLRRLELGLQQLGVLRLVSQRLQQLAHRHLFSVMPGCGHAQVRTFGVL